MIESNKVKADQQKLDKAGIVHKRLLTGSVVSDKMHKTIVVSVDRQVKHGLYKKFIKTSKRYKAHDENNEAKLGDLVQIVETRPFSRQKRWALKGVVRKAVQTLLVAE